MASELWHMHACVFVCDFSDASTHLVHSHLPTAREPHIHSPAHTRPQACSHKLHKCSLHSILNRFAVGATPRIYPFFLSLAERGNRENFSLNLSLAVVLRTPAGFNVGASETTATTILPTLQRSPGVFTTLAGAANWLTRANRCQWNQQTPALARIATTHGLCCSLTYPRSLFSKSF